MKKTLSTLCVLLSMSAGAYASTKSDPESGLYTFTVNGEAVVVKLCTTEVCTIGSKGVQEVKSTPKASALDTLAKAANGDTPTHLVFYPEGGEGVESERLILRNRFYVELKEGESALALQQRHGLQRVESLRPGSRLLVCYMNNATEVVGVIDAIEQDTKVVSVEPLFAKIFKPSVPVPRDEYFEFVDGADGYQWSLRNVGENGGVRGNDINLLGPFDEVNEIFEDGAWDVALGMGAGIKVGIVDDGFAHEHTDLVGSSDVDNDHSWNDFVTPDDPSPIDENWKHGTAVGGVVGASTNDDGYGMTGVAPGCDLVGLQLIAGPIDDRDIAEALTWRNDLIHIYNNSWGWAGSGSTLRPSGRLIQEALVDGATEGRGGLGSIFVFSAGNSAEESDNSNYSELTSSIHTIAVGAIADGSSRSFYSEKGANLVVSAPSDGGAQGIVAPDFTVDEVIIDGVVLVQQYEQFLHRFDFGGTSAAAPLVSGVIALMLEVNPDLGWRDVQEILMATAAKVSPNSAGWVDNAAGFHFNHDFGAGRVDATAAVKEAALRAESAQVLDPVTQIEKFAFIVDDVDPQTGLLDPNAGVIPDGTGIPYVYEIDMSDQPGLRVEHVQVLPMLLTQRRADLDISLVSPSGTQSILTEFHEGSSEQSVTRYPFMTVRNWGESSKGIWRLVIHDRKVGPVPTVPAILNDVRLIIHGVPDEDAPLADDPLLLSNRVIRGIEGFPMSVALETVNVNSVTIGQLPELLVLEETPSGNSVRRRIVGTPTTAGIYTVPLTMTGDSDEVTVFLSIIIEPAEFGLGVAVEQQDRATVSGGDAPWDFEGEDTSDGIDAVASAIGLSDNRESVFGFNGFPSGYLYFDWRSSSREGSDRLYFNTGQSNVFQNWTAFLDGDTPWGTAAMALTEESNSVRWIYRKDHVSEIGGDDRGYLDQVIHVTELEHIQALRRNADFDFGFNNQELNFDVPSGLSWVPTVDLLADGDDKDVIASSRIGNGQQVAFTTVLPGGGTFSFNYRTSSEAADVLEVFVNGVLLLSEGGEMDQYQEFTTPLPETEVGNLVEVRYRKNVAANLGNDMVFLDDIIYTPVGEEAVNTFAIWSSGDERPDDDDDGDGYNNAIDYAFSRVGEVSNLPSLLPKFTKIGLTNALEFGFNYELKDRNFKFQESYDLVVWEDVPLGTPKKYEGKVHIHEVPIFPVDKNVFYRVVATKK